MISFSFLPRDNRLTDGFFLVLCFQDFFFTFHHPCSVVFTTTVSTLLFPGTENELFLEIHDSSARPVLQRAHCRALPRLLRRLGTVRFIIKLYSLLEFSEDAKTVNHWGKLNLECISHKLTGFNPLRVWVQIRKGVFKLSLNYSQFLSLCNNDVFILTPFLFLKDDLHSVPL